MSIIEAFFVRIGFGWQLSKISPFILVFVLFYFLSVLILKSYSRTSKSIRKWLSIGIGLSTMAGYFALYPIYSGDFSNRSRTETMLSEIKLISNSKLIVVAIPNCPYCYESIQISNQLLERNKDLKITYVVFGNSSESYASYKKIANKGIEFKLASDIEKLSKLANHVYPSFLLKQEGKLIVWSNNDLGPASLDYIEENL